MQEGISSDVGSAAQRAWRGGQGFSAAVNGWPLFPGSVCCFIAGCSACAPEAQSMRKTSSGVIFHSCAYQVKGFLLCKKCTAIQSCQSDNYFAKLASASTGTEVLDKVYYIVEILFCHTAPGLLFESTYWPKTDTCFATIWNALKVPFNLLATCQRCTQLCRCFPVKGELHCQTAALQNAPALKRGPLLHP